MPPDAMQHTPPAGRRRRWYPSHMHAIRRVLVGARQSCSNQSQLDLLDLLIGDFATMFADADDGDYDAWMQSCHRYYDTLPHYPKQGAPGWTVPSPSPET